MGWETGRAAGHVEDASFLMEEIREWGHEESNFFAVCTEVVVQR